MAKKLRDSAYVNDLVLYRNACEEKKLKFTLTQLENLKSIYSRQKEQEKMYFAVQHMAVPVKTDPVIRNLRKGLQLGPGAESRSKSAPVFSTSGDRTRVNPSSKRLMPGRGHQGRSAPVGGTRDATTQAVAVDRTQRSNTRVKLAKSRIVISPEPDKRGKRKEAHIPANSEISTAGHKQNTHSDQPSLDSLLSPRSDVIHDKNEPTDDGWHDDVIPDSQSTRINPQRRAQRIHSWNKEGGPRRDKYDQPRLNDLPPVSINIYELPCSEKESKEKWRKLVLENRSSVKRDTRNEVKQTRENQEIRRKWLSTYQDVKKDRITAMVKENLKIEDGEQLTLVKFLPKSRQSNFIKEAQQSQHKI